MPIMIVDRRRMRRKLTFWRVVAVLVAIVAVVGGALMLDRQSHGLDAAARRARSRASRSRA